jgi:hypothetical protein
MQLHQQQQLVEKDERSSTVFEQRRNSLVSATHTARIPSPLPLHVVKTGRNNLNEEFTPLLPTGIGERF